MAYQRRRFLINRRFQIRFSIYVCSWLIALTFIFPWIVSSLFDFFVRYVSHDPNGPPLAFVRHTQAEVVGLLIALQLVLLLIAFLLSIFLSHRVAGPIYKLRRFIERAAVGDLAEEMRFRDSDHFKDVAERFNEMTRALKFRLKKNSDAIELAISHLESGQASDSDKEALVQFLKDTKALNRELKL